MNKLFACVVAIALSALCAYPQADPWESLRSINPGHKIRVHTNGKKQTGTFVSVSEDALRFQTSSGDIAVPRPEVARVYWQSKSHRVRNAIIGTVVGVAAGAVLYGTFGTLLRNEGDDETAPLLVVPIAVGAGIGGALPTGRMKLIYEVKKK